MRFEHLGVDQGLSQSNVLGILQDSRGLMWFGTENGLNRYDGYHFKQFKRERGNPSALYNDFVFDLAETPDGTLWVATNGGGLARFDQTTESFTSYLHDANDARSIPTNHIRRIVSDASGALWLATQDAGLVRFDPEYESFESVAFDVPVKGLFALLVDARGTLWVGGDHGLTRLDPESGEMRHWQHEAENPASLSKGSVRAVAQDSYGNLWVGTYGGGLNRLDDGGQGFLHFRHDADDPRSLSADRITTIVEDQGRRLWIGTNAGLDLFDRRTGSVDRFTREATNAQSLSGNRVTSIYEDRSGLLWVGTQTQGVNTWNPRTWGYGYDPATELARSAEQQPNVTSFIVDEAGTLWLGTFGDGLHAIDRRSGEMVHYRTTSEDAYQLPDDRVMALLHDRDGGLWVGTMTQGLLHIDTESGIRTDYRHDPNDPASLGGNGVVTLYQDGAGRLWVGTYGAGISRFDPVTGQFTRFTHDDADPYSISSDRIMSFAEDRSGMIWVGTEGGGLNLFNPATGRFHHFLHDPDDVATLAGETVYDIAVDAHGVVWVGTRSGGVDRVIGTALDPDAITFSNLSEKDGLANDVVYGIEFDDAGWLWMSTNYGISRYHPGRGEVRNIRQIDGLQSNEFNFGAHYRSASGELFFGGHNGYNAFDPAAIEINEVAPLIALTGFYNGSDGERASLPEGDDGVIDIPWDMDDIAFEFAALDFTAPANNRYQYKLEGRDDTWNDLGTNRRISYTDLNDGRYTLRVRAANSDGVWSESDYTLTLRVAPAPWDSWWAYLGYALTALFTISALIRRHRRRLAQEEAYSRRLEQEVQQRTESLRDSNEQLKTLNHALQRSSLSDPLTGLHNRRFVFEEISRDIETIQRVYQQKLNGETDVETKELVFMMIDLDNFKPINDTYGHAAGDAMLIQLRDLLLSICRRTDFVVRWGGDEFVVIARHTRPEEPEALAERIRAEIDQHRFELSDGVVARTTCSIGFVAYPLLNGNPGSASIDNVISLADGLMYEAKRHRNAWVGMLNADQVVTSENFDHEAIEATSLLFRARRAQNINRHGSQSQADDVQSRVLSIGEAGRT